MILIGDPKQAIYAFRGADVFSYLDAVQQADQVRTLAVNWRSDQALVDALDACWAAPLSVTSESWSARWLPITSSGG